MYITRIELRDFRNFTTLTLEPQRALTVLVGQNATGKTNTAEAIQIICTGSSFRNPLWGDLVRSGYDTASVVMKTEGEIAPVDVSLAISQKGTRIWRVGGVQKRRVSDATRFTPVVSFTPDDLGMVKGSAEHRRMTLDALGEQLSPVYGTLRRDYGRVVRQRNTLLRDGAPDQAIEPWNTQLVSLGARLHTHRRRLLGMIARETIPLYEHLSDGERLEITMCDRCGVGLLPAGEEIARPIVESGIREMLAVKAAEERARGVTLVGPHRDDVQFTINDRDARAFASQGQQRTIALAWKLAEVAVVKDVLAKTPVLLLDDVMSELDSRRRAALTDLIQRETQTFVTTTNTGYFEPTLLRSALVVDMAAVHHE